MKKVIVGMFLLIGIGCFSLYKPKDEEQVLKEEAINSSNLVGVYIQNGDSYTKSDTIPESGYEFNQEESYCKIGNNRQDHITLNYNPDTKELSVTPLSSKDTKCYLYFDEEPSAADVILANSIRGSGTPNFANTSCSNGTNNGSNCDEATVGLYEGEENGETIYYFRGDVDDNWVQFAGYYWRIIRTNSDGSIRMIYNGTSTATGTGTQIGTSAFNSIYNASYYVGFKYTIDEQHGTSTNSTVLDVLNTWYSSNLATYASKLTSGTGFCNDRDMASGYSWSVNPGSTIYYASYERLQINRMPSLDCNTVSDNFTTSGSEVGNGALQYPIGLITADEVAMAGGTFTTGNNGYYLYTGQNYLTISPTNVDSVSNAGVFRVYSTGSFGGSWVANTYGVRPVINLRADVELTGTGTSSDPYVVEGA